MPKPPVAAIQGLITFKVKMPFQTGQPEGRIEGDTIVFGRRPEDFVRKAGTQDLVRTVYVSRPGHATQTVVEKIAAFQMLIDASIPVAGRAPANCRIA